MKFHAIFVSSTLFGFALANGQQSPEARHVAAVKRGNMIRDVPVVEERDGYYPPTSTLKRRLSSPNRIRCTY